MEEQYYQGEAADMVNNEPIAHHYILADPNYKV